MSSNPFNAPLSLKVEPSRVKSLLILCPHVLILVMVLWIDEFSGGLRWILMSVIIVSWVYYSRLHLALSLKRSIKKITQDSAKHWFIDTPYENHRPVMIEGSSFLSNYLIIINYTSINKSRYTVIFTRKCLSSDNFRRLSVRLKIN